MREAVLDKLAKLGLDQAAATLDSRAEEAARKEWAYTDFLENLLEDEVQARRARFRETRTRLAGFPFIKQLDDFRFDQQPGVDKKQVLELATLSFLARKDNVILLGPPGVGKSHLSVALGLKAIEAQSTVYFITLDRLVADLMRSHLARNLERRMAVYIRPALLIIDEVGYLPLDRQAANLLFQVISRRYERASTIVTSNKSYGEWGDFLGDSALAAATLDRLLHHSVTLNIRGDSYRLREKRKAGILAPPATLKGVAGA